MKKQVRISALLLTLFVLMTSVGNTYANEVVFWTDTIVDSYENPICTESVTVNSEITLQGTDHIRSDGSVTTHLHVRGVIIVSTDEDSFRDTYNTNLTIEVDAEGNVVEIISNGLRFHWLNLIHQAGRIDDITHELLAGPVYVDPELEADFRAYSGFTGSMVG